MKQLTMNFEKRKNEKFSPERVKKVCELVNAGATPREAIAIVRMGAACAKLLIDVGIIKKVGKDEWKAVEKLHQSTYTEFLRLRIEYNKMCNQRVKHKTNGKATSYYPAPKADTDMVGLVNMPKSKPVKKAVALPWWKRILLYLANQ
jgi:hypothetical protein